MILLECRRINSENEMNSIEVRESTHQLQFVAGFNARYHQILERNWGIVDRGIKITVGVIAIVGVWASTSGEKWTETSNLLGWVSLIMAVILNVVQTTEYERYHGEMFRKWSDLMADAKKIQSRHEMEGKDTASPETRNRICDAIDLEHSLHANQPAPFLRLLAKCESDEIEATYGPGIRTHAQAHEFIKSLRLPQDVDAIECDVIPSAEAGQVSVVEKQQVAEAAVVD